MKKLILSLIFIPCLVLAGEISDKDIESKFLTVVKDAEVETVLGKSSEFNECREQSKFVATDTPDQKEEKIKKAKVCFSKHTSGKNAEALKKLAEELKLQNYGLIKSKSVNDITEYLAKKMHKSLTGIDPDDKNAKTLKWEDQKIVDQKIFVDLYTSQLLKNALFEVSRFCFEDLRFNGSTESTFAEHWAIANISLCTNPKTGKVSGCAKDVSKINDNGSPSFFKIQDTTDMSKKDEVYKDVLGGLTKTQAPMDPKQYEYYFTYCQTALPLLCEQFKTHVAANVNQDSVVDGKTAVSVSGGKACLTLERLQLIRTAMKNTKKVADQFEEMGADKDKFALQMIKNPKIYQNGKGTGEDSLDEISSFSSNDMLDKAEENDLEKLETECAQGKGTKCDDFLVVGDSLEKAIHNVEYEMNLKKAIELEQFEKIKDKPEELEKYLSDNGHFDLLAQIKNPPQGFDIAKQIGAVYDARKIAEIENLRNKVGKRQVTEEEEKQLDPGAKNARIAANIKDTKEERARLAQVVMFNNIITSQLDLTDKASGKSVGRNVNGLNKELEGMGKSYDDKIFSGIKADAEKNGSKVDDTSIVGGGIIDAILGKAPDP